MSAWHGISDAEAAWSIMLNPKTAEDWEIVKKARCLCQTLIRNAA